MSRTKATELDNRADHADKRRSCPVCNPRHDRVPMDRVWQWSLDHPGEKPFR